MVGCNTLVLFTAFSSLLCDVSANIATEARTFRDNIAVDPLEALKACLLNWELAAGEFDRVTYTQVRKLMNARGLLGGTWHVGHIRPNVPGTPRESPGAGPEDMGINFFAQHRHDNQKLGASWPSVEELVHYCRFGDLERPVNKAVERPNATRAVLDVVGNMTVATSRAVASAALATTRATFRGLTIVLPVVGQFTIATSEAVASAALATTRATFHGLTIVLPVVGQFTIATIETFAFAAIATSSIITGTGSLAFATVNAACTTVARGAVKTVEKGAVKAVEKGAVKAVEKGAAHLAKWAPGAGLAVGAYFANERAQDGHHGQAALETLSGAASVVPVVGTAASMAIDGVNFLIDVSGYNF